jgi:hypothetical protein
MDLLLPGYEHQIINGAGLSVTEGAPKIVLHTTETGQGAANNLINHWRGNWGSGLPHFIVDGVRVVQLLPLNVGGYTLENHQGGVDTNRAGPPIQAEICGYAASDWDDLTYESVGKLLADIKRAGHDFDINNYTRFWGADEEIVLASYSSPIRMAPDEYKWYNGWTDHAHVPENAHWDIGKKNGDRLHAIALAHLGIPSTLPPEEDIMATKEELQAIVRAEGDRIIAAVSPADDMWMATSEAESRVYMVINMVKYHIPGSTDPDPAVAKAQNDGMIRTLEFLGFDNRGVQDQALAVLPEAPWKGLGST